MSINKNFLPEIILVNPQLPENLGAVARAMLNFHFKKLRVVSPRFNIKNEKIIPVSAGAEEIINKMSDELTQHLHQPVPKEVVITTDAPWEGNTSAYYSIFRDDGLFRMYYRGSHWDTNAKKEPHREVTCYAESRDGVNWVKPKLGLFQFNGSSENNIVLDGLGTHCFVAFKDQNPNVSSRVLYKGISRGWPIGEKGLYVYGSPDGFNWKLMNESPVILDGYFDSQNLAFWDP